MQPKQPLSRDVVADIAVRLNTTHASLADIRFLFILLVGYAGIFRIGEILDIRIKDINIFDDHMALTLSKRKNDQYRKGHVSIISRSGKPTCPVGITEGLLSLLPDKKGSPNPVVRRIVKSKRAKEKFHKSLGISYSSVREIVKAYIAPNVSNPCLFGTQSIRIRGTNDLGFRSLDPSLQERHGGWRNPNSKFRYLEATTEELVKFTQVMDI